jgi:BASS family bile acid:Na+ symporter
MLLSTMAVSGENFRYPRKLFVPVLTGVVMNYAVLGSLFIGMSGLLRIEEPLRIGFIILASVPCAVAVIPFTGFLNGDNEFSLAGTLGCYLGAFLIMPLIASCFLEFSFEYQSRLLIILIELILVPLILSRILRFTGISSHLESVKGTMINWSFFLVVYTSVSLNREFFLQPSISLLKVAAVAVASTFVLGTVIEGVGLFSRVDPKKVTSIVLLGTLKNYGFASGLALILFDSRTSVPPTVSVILMTVFIVWLSVKKPWGITR